MNVSQLRDELEGLPGDMEVRLATQPNYPLAYELADQVAVVGECEFDFEEDEDDNEVEVCTQHGNPRGECDATEYVWLAEGYQLGYLPGAVSNELAGFR